MGCPHGAGGEQPGSIDHAERAGEPDPIHGFLIDAGNIVMPGDILHRLAEFIGLRLLDPQNILAGQSGEKGMGRKKIFGDELG